MSLSPSTDEAVVALAVPPSRRPWIAPIVEALPRLTELTLASPIGGGGGIGGGGSTVFGLLLAVGLLASGCSADQSTAPTSPSMPAAVTAVICTANVTAKVVSCGGPQNGPLAADDEIIGGQGSRVILRSTNVLYAGTDFTFDVTVQNVGAQSLGTDGSSATGVRIFFENDPAVASGSGLITVEDDSTGTFTGLNQPYYIYTDSLPAHATSVAVPWHFSVPGTVNSFTFQVLVSSQVPAHGGLLRWQPIAAISRVRYNSVAWAGGNDAMAVGEQGYSSRWNGTSWTPIPPVTGASFIKVAAVSPGVYVAVADSGKVFKFSNKLWTEVYDSPTPAGWQAVWVRDANHWFAVGNNAALLTYDNGTFTETNLAGGETLSMIAGTANNDITMLAAQSGATYTSSLGGPFLSTGNLVPDASWFLGAIAFDASGALIRSQISIGPWQGYIIRSGAAEDTIFAAIGVYATALWPFLSDSLIAPIGDVLANAVTVNKVRFGAAPHDSTAITPTYGNSPFDLTRLNTAGTNFAMIDNNQGIETSVGGGAWTPVVDSTVGSYAASWGRGDSVWVADTSGKLWKIVDGTATQLIGIAGATGIWGFSGAELYITAGGTVYKGDGVAPWTVETVIAGATIRSIWGDAASGTLIVPASSKRYMQRVGGVWTEPAPASDFFKGVWGCSSGQAWMAGVNGEIFDWTPTGLTADPGYTAGSPIYAVTGTGCSDVWAGGPNSKLFHFDGVTWSPVAIGGVDQIFISSLASQSNGVVYVGGEQSKIAAVNAAGITSRMRSSDQWDDILTLWRLDDGDLFVGGNEHAILGRR